MRRVAMMAIFVLLLALAGIFVVSGQSSRETAKSPVRVGIIMLGNREESTWNAAHWQGLQAAAQELNLSLECLENVTVLDCDAAIEQLARDHCRVIVSTSVDFQDEVSRWAAKFPQIYFFQAAGTHSHANVATYMGRMYQMRYLSGIVAGRQITSHAIGYVATQPMPEVVRGIDAFTLGVRSVDPKAVVYVRYTYSWTDDARIRQVTAALLDDCPSIDVLTMHLDTAGPLAVAAERGIYTIGCNVDKGSQYPDTFLTATVWNWKIFYIQHIREALNGKFEGRSYLVGANTGIVALAPLTARPSRTTSVLLEQERARLVSGEYDVFYGPIRDNQGNLRVEAGEGLSDKTLFDDLDWYVEGVQFP